MTEIRLSREEFERFLRGLREQDDRLELLAPNEVPSRDEAVDAYTFSAHVEALRAGDIDEDVWGTLEDLELTANSEDEAWKKIKAWYAGRGGVLLTVSGGAEGSDEFVLAEELARRLKLL